MKKTGITYKILKSHIKPKAKSALNKMVAVSGWNDTLDPVEDAGYYEHFIARGVSRGNMMREQYENRLGLDPFPSKGTGGKYKMELPYLLYNIEHILDDVKYNSDDARSEITTSMIYSDDDPSYVMDAFAVLLANSSDHRVREIASTFFYLFATIGDGLSTSRTDKQKRLFKSLASMITDLFIIKADLNVSRMARSSEFGVEGEDGLDLVPVFTLHVKVELRNYTHAFYLIMKKIYGSGVPHAFYELLVSAYMETQWDPHRYPDIFEGKRRNFGLIQFYDETISEVSKWVDDKSIASILYGDNSATSILEDASRDLKEVARYILGDLGFKDENFDVWDYDKQFFYASVYLFKRIENNDTGLTTWPGSIKGLIYSPVVITQSTVDFMGLISLKRLDNAEINGQVDAIYYTEFLGEINNDILDLAIAKVTGTIVGQTADATSMTNLSVALSVFDPMSRIPQWIKAKGQKVSLFDIWFAAHMYFVSSITSTLGGKSQTDGDNLQQAIAMGSGHFMRHLRFTLSPSITTYEGPTSRYMLDGLDIHSLYQHFNQTMTRISSRP